MSDEFWENPEDFSISPSEPDSVPSGVQNPFLTLFARIDVSFNGLVEELSSMDGVRVAPFEYYHLTVKQVGEFGSDKVSDLVSEIESAISESDPFSVSLSGVDVFPNCVYIPVMDCEALVSLHQQLCSISYLEAGDFEGESYLPHITIAKFVSEDVDVGELYEVLSNYRDTEWIDITIDSVHLVKDAPVQSENEMFPPFESVGSFELGS